MKALYSSILLIAALVSSVGYILYIYLARESNFWWSNIKDIEKLISFRTEQGLFYSYFQEIIEQNSFINGLFVLYQNNMTEYPQKINIINRMNIWQEILLGLIYRIANNLQIINLPIEFYVNSVILLQFISISSIFFLSYLINHSVLAGILSVGFFALNRHAMSRVVYVLPLRENFALPFWWLHILTFHLLIQSKKPSASMQKFIRNWFYVSTFLFCLQWQFSQFALLLECVVIFGLEMFEFISPAIARGYYWTGLICLLGTCVMQMGNLMLLSSITVSVMISSLILGSYKSPDVMHSSFSGRLTWISMQSTGRLLLAFFLRFLSIWIFKQRDDSHIFQFLAVKFGIGSSRNFDVNLYKCHEGFGWMQVDKFLNSLNMVVYPYILVHSCLGLAIFVSVLAVLWHDTEEEEELHPTIHESIVGAEGDFCSGCGHLLSNYPELTYHFGLSTAMLLLALMVQRMQYLFTPYIVIFASFLYGNRIFYEKMAKLLTEISFIYYPPSVIDSNENNKKSFVSHRISTISQFTELTRQAIVIGLICKVAIETFYSVRTELSDLREFYDPDTVQLMKWIQHSTYPNHSFAGSMQLMAAVKLVGKRPIANHPHYEDSQLRLKTRKLYQIYGKKDPEYVAKILKYYFVSYIILEDSICLARSNGCQLKDIIDLANGHMPEKRYFSDFDLRHVNIPRFCDAIRFLNSNGNKSFGKYFQESFVNPTFRVYRVL